MIINQDFKEFIRLLNENKVDDLIVGGFALAFHGYPRYTQDIDFWVWMDKENATNIIKVIKEFGFSALDLRVEDFLNDENVIQLGYPPNRIDILTAIDGVDFKNAFSNKVIYSGERIRMNFIGIDQLIQNKKASGRYQDLADLEILEKIKKNNEDNEKRT